MRQERSGRISRCRLDAGPIFQAAVWLNRYSKYWQQQFDLLAAVVEDIGKRRVPKDGVRPAPPAWSQPSAPIVSIGRNGDMDHHHVVSQEAWTKTRKELLTREKEFTRLRDQLSRERRELPWVRVDKPYVFEGADGKATLPDLFEGRSQLIVYHFMFDPAWDAGARAARSGPTTSRHCRAPQSSGCEHGCDLEGRRTSDKASDLLTGQGVCEVHLSRARLNPSPLLGDRPVISSHMHRSPAVGHAGQQANREPARIRMVCAAASPRFPNWRRRSRKSFADWAIASMGSKGRQDRASLPSLA